jgi:hypothetical protein
LFFSVEWLIFTALLEMNSKQLSYVLGSFKEISDGFVKSISTITS